MGLWIRPAAHQDTGWEAKVAGRAASFPSRAGRDRTGEKRGAFPPPGVIPQAAGRKGTVGVVVSPPLARGIGGVVLSFYYLICRLRSRPRAVSRLTPLVCVCGFKGVHGVGASPGLLLCVHVPCTTVDVSLRVFSAARTASSRAANVSTGDRTMSSTAERLVPTQARPTGRPRGGRGRGVTSKKPTNMRRVKVGRANFFPRLSLQVW